MAGHSIPIDLRVDPETTQNIESRNKILSMLKALIEPFSGPLDQVAYMNLPKDNYQIVYVVKESETTLSVKVYGKKGLVSATLDRYTEDVNKQLIGIDEAMKLEDSIRNHCNVNVVKVLPAIKRAPALNPYFTSSDDRILEYDVDSVLFSEKTPFQKVDVVHTKSFGNMLVLDNLQNLAESDTEYTHGLMNKGVDEYKGKTVLILGGGDGALLYELLKEDPKHVLMIDIDEAVMRSCKKFLRSACGTCLDDFKGDNYEVVVGDAIAYMEKAVKEGVVYDYVFADLTDIPISPAPVGDTWDFVNKIVNLGTKCLKPGTGRYMTHAIGAQCTEALSQFSAKLNAVEVGVSSLTQSFRYVPSFMEKWVFFQLTRKPVC